MTHYRFFILESCQPRKRGREKKRRVSTRIKHPSTKDKGKENGRKNSGNKGKKKKEIKHETEVASRDRTQRSTGAAIQGILVLLVLAYARVRALIPTTGSFIQTYAPLVCVRTVKLSRAVVGDDRAPRGGEKSSLSGGARSGKGEGRRREDSFSTRQPERRMRLRQSSRSLVIYHSPSRSPLLLPCPIAFSVRLSVSNIEFPLYNSLYPIYRPAYVRTYFWFIRRTLLSSLWFQRHGTGMYVARVRVEKVKLLVVD